MLSEPSNQNVEKGVANQIGLVRTEPHPLHNNWKKDTKRLTWNTCTDIADQNRPELPVLRRFNDISHCQSLRNLLSIGCSVFAQDISLVIDAHPLSSKFLFLLAEKPRGSWFLGKHNEGEKSDKDGHGTFDDKQVLPIVESSMKFENPVRLCVSVLQF